MSIMATKESIELFKLMTESKEPYKGQVRLVKQVLGVLGHYENISPVVREIPPKLQQFDGEKWVDVEILEIQD